MKTIKITNPDFVGRVDVVRHACRGIVEKQNKVLIGYLANEDTYIIPGGGVECNETFSQCCAREVLEETGIVCAPQAHYLDIDELFGAMQHVNHYFVCNLVDETENICLTQAEKDAHLTFLWLPVEQAIDIFSTYENYKSTNVEKFGLYRREMLALQEYRKLQTTLRNE